MPLTERFWKKVERGEDCWEWLAARNQYGYGIFHTGRRANGSKISSLAHRVAYMDAFGPITPEQQLDHLCQNRGCVRPDHLEVVDIAEHGHRETRTGTPHQAAR